jgi:hypothetical protein
MSKPLPLGEPVAAPGVAPAQTSVPGFVRAAGVLPLLAIGAIGLAILAVLVSIGINAVRDQGLMPPPDILDRYECSGPGVAFQLSYLHDTERVKIQSAQGLFDGTLHANRFDWGRFNGDTATLGFMPPQSIVFEDSSVLRLQLPGGPEMKCSIAAPHSSHRRQIVQ